MKKAKEYYINNKESIKDYQKQYRKNNPLTEDIKEYQKQYRKNMTDDQKQKMKEYKKKYHETKKLNDYNYF